jgi:hypothetical protein
MLATPQRHQEYPKLALIGLGTCALLCSASMEKTMNRRLFASSKGVRGI